MVAHTAEPLSMCFTTSFLICSVFNQLVSQGNQNICFIPEGSGLFWDGESREAPAQAPPHTPQAAPGSIQGNVGSRSSKLLKKINK